jgi:hypothetical protein
VRDWYVESFRDLRAHPPVKDAADEVAFTELLRHVYRRHVSLTWGQESDMGTGGDEAAWLGS